MSATLPQKPDPGGGDELAGGDNGAVQGIVGTMVLRVEWRRSLDGRGQVSIIEVAVQPETTAADVCR
jgi:hypothetical protein